MSRSDVDVDYSKVLHLFGTTIPHVSQFFGGQEAMFKIDEKNARMNNNMLCPRKANGRTCERDEWDEAYFFLSNISWGTGCHTELRFHQRTGELVTINYTG